MKAHIVSLILLIVASLVLIAQSPPISGEFESDVEPTMKWMKKNDQRLFSNRTEEEVREAMFREPLLRHVWADGKLTTVIRSDWQLTMKRDWQMKDSNTYEVTIPATDSLNSEEVWTLKILSPDRYYVDLLVNSKRTREYFKRSSEPDAAHEPPPAAAVGETSENMNTNLQSEAPADGGGR